MSGRLDGKVALVTGAGRGIGRAIATKLASEGARVIVNDLDAEVAEDCVRDIRSVGGEAVACVGSVTEGGFADRFVGLAVSRYAGLDIIVNNAGYTWDGAIQRMSDEQWYAMIDCHLTAPFRILRSAQPIIRGYVEAETRAGRREVRKVVNTSSISGLFGNAGQVNYSSAKAGVIGMTQALAKEWGRFNVTVNCVAYGLILTRLTEATADENTVVKIEGRDIEVGVSPELMSSLTKGVPLGHVGTPEEAAGAAYLLCIPESNYISGQVLLCTGGVTGI